MKLGILLTVFLAFTVYTIAVMIDKGVVGFLLLAWAEPWGMQVLIDLCIMLSIFGVWMMRDSRKHGLNGWLYLPLLLAGSPGALLYLIRREWLLRGKSQPVTAEA